MDRIGKYEIRKKLGEGATSTVYLAYDSFSGREVAVKAIFPEVLKDHEKGQIYRHLLVNEASLAGKLLHPHIVQIFDAVIDSDQSYIVMEYVPGGTLEQFCSPDTLLPLERIVEMIFKCTSALKYANRHGITHRDIKPANILLAHEGDTGDIKISDFGAALMSGNETTRTQVSGIGSPSYMSPQQVRELPLNHQTDIYSLGVVMYQLLTGRLPFTASNNYSMVYQITGYAPPPPSTFRTDIPSSLDAIVARAMQKELDARYATWEEFSHDLAQSFRNKHLSAQAQEVPDSQKFETLRSLPFFADFSDVQIWEVVRFSIWDDAAAGTMIIRDGEPGNFFSFLVEGELRVAKHRHTLSILKPGDCFGEMAVIHRHNHLRGANVVAQTQSRLVTISAEALRHASEACRMHFYQSFLEVISTRLRQANVQLATI